MREINPFIKLLIETNIDLIENEDYRTLLKRCLPGDRKKLLKVLKDAGIKVPEYDLGKIFGAVIDPKKVNKLIKNTLADLGITYETAYNDKGKTGRKFKYSNLNVDLDKKRQVEDAIHKVLEDNGIDYEYISMHESITYRFYLPMHYIDLVVRINADEV